MIWPRHITTPQAQSLFSERIVHMRHLSCLEKLIHQARSLLLNCNDAVTWPWSHKLRIQRPVALTGFGGVLLTYKMPQSPFC